jgi:hypothetical protein
MAARKAELLPVPYFHVMFTLPGELNRLCLYAPERVYDALFATAWSVIDSFAGDGVHLGARTGMIAILHTWGQNLSLMGQAKATLRLAMFTGEVASL